MKNKKNDELLDLVDKNDNVVGTVWKSEAHGNPDLIHREIAVAVFYKDEILLQQRSLKKVNGPGKWEITCAGHVGSSEDPKIASEREVFEELGFKVDLTFYKKVFSKHLDSNNNPTESRYFYIYYSIVNNKPQIKLDKNEVEDAKWIKLSELKSFSLKNNYKLDGISHKTIIEIAKMLKII